jgi:hypothetical protein
MTFDPVKAMFAEMARDPKLSPAFKEGLAVGVAEYDLRIALARLSNEVLGSLPLMEPLCRREFGNTNYNLLIQRAEEARKLLER